MDITVLIADILSLITISMSLFLKVPQIVSLHKLKITRGINLYGLLMELSSYSVTMSYNVVNGYALLSYLEYPIIIFQEYILIYLVLYYQNSIGRKTLAFTLLYFLTLVALMARFIPPSVLLFLVPLATPVSLSSKVIQLWEIFTKWNADSVSVSTWVLSALTNASRIYTIYMDSADMILLTNFILSSLLSSSIAVSAYLLQKQPKRAD